MACPQRAHAGSVVRRHGERSRGGVRYVRFRCAPDGGPAHVFQVELSSTDELVVRPYLPPERCARHPDAVVQRWGTYQNGGVARQRYRCQPEDEPTHTFTPLLPRDHVHDGERCQMCSEHRGIHRGETATARGHRTHTPLVAEALVKLSQGNSYAAVGQEVRREPRGEEATGPDVWRLPADWVEVFSPVLYEPWSAQAREEVLERRRAPGKKDPTVLVLDDLPVFASARGGRKPLQRYAVIAAAEVLPTPTGRTTRLRLLRAFPDRGKAAYGLVLQELGYVPGILVSDGAPGIKGALTALVAEDPSVNCLQVLSSFHIRRMLWRQLAKLTTAKPTFALGDLADQLDRFQLLASPAAWDGWWDTLRRRTVAQRVPKKAWPAKWESDYKPVIDEQLRALRPWPWVPASTGAI